MPADPSKGLIMSQGGLLQHLVFALIGLWITKRVEPTYLNKSCYEQGELCVDQNYIELPFGVLTTSLDDDGETEINTVTSYETRNTYGLFIDSEVDDEGTPYLVARSDHRKETAKVLFCILQDSMENEKPDWVLVKDDFPSAIPKLYMMHGAVFLVQLIVLIWSQNDKSSHLHNILTIMSIPLY